MMARWISVLFTVLVLPWPALAGGTKLSVGYVPAGDFLPAFVAQDKGFFAAHGLDVALTRIMLASNVPAALISGSLDIGMATAPGLLQAADSGLDLVVVSGMSRLTKAPSFVSLVARRGAGIRRAADLEGRKIGVPGFNSMFDVTFRKWLIDNGVPLGKVGIVEAPFPRMRDMLASGTVDAVAVIEPFRSRITADGTGTRVADFLAEVNPDVPGAFWIATRGWIAGHSAVLPAFRAALAEAIALIARDRAGAEAVERHYLGVVSPVLPEFSLVVTPADLGFFADLGRQLGMLRQRPDIGHLLAAAP